MAYVCAVPCTGSEFKEAYWNYDLILLLDSGSSDLEARLNRTWGFFGAISPVQMRLFSSFLLLFLDHLCMVISVTPY